MLYVVMYLAAIVLANLTIAAFGPGMAIFNAFFLIGLDLTARDRLHDAWKNNSLFQKMCGLIAAGSLLSYFLNSNAGAIAFASFVAFASAASVDTMVYHLLGGYSRWFRVNGSNVPSAAVDSLVFPILAFGLPVSWEIVYGQFMAKILGGLCWSFVLNAIAGKMTAKHSVRIPASK